MKAQAHANQAWSGVNQGIEQIRATLGKEDELTRLQVRFLMKALDKLEEVKQTLTDVNIDMLIKSGEITEEQEDEYRGFYA